MNSSEHEPAITQFNLGERSRIAGRDYYEGRIPDSIKVYLAITASDRLDEEAIDNERLFYYRFGIDVRRPVREQVVALKRQYGLTDAECRWLRHSGQFSINHEGAKLAPDRVVPAAAWFYAFVLAYYFGSSLLLINFSGAASWKQSLGSLTLVGLWFGSMWAIDRLFWAPWRWVKKSVEAKALYSDTQLRHPSGT
jgi:hypothetical protein